MDGRKSPDKQVEKITVTPELLEQIIAKAASSFTKGTTYNRQIHSQLAKNAELQSKYRDDSLSDFVSVIDPAYLTIDANHFPNTNFIAARGPQTANDMYHFIRNTVYHPTKPVHHIVALGRTATYEREHHQDIYDYMLKERSTQYGPYKITIKRLSGESTTTLSEDCSIAHGIVNSVLTILDTSDDQAKPEVLKVTIIELEDNQALDLVNNKMFRQDKYTFFDGPPATMDMNSKQALSDIYDLSAEKFVLIHCSGGVGRTGHLLLILLLVKQYEEIFTSHNPDISAANIHKQLAFLRNYRCASVNTLDQFTQAIRCAHLLYHYRLELKQKQVVTTTPLIISPISIFQLPSVQPASQKSASPVHRPKS